MASQVWLLIDNRAGNINQLLGIAEHLKLPFEEKKIEYSKLVILPNFLKRSSLIGIKQTSKNNLTPPYPDLVIGAGRRVFPVARFIKKASKGKTKIVQLMNPGPSGFQEADLIAIPTHDDYNGYSNNVIRTLGAPHRVTKEKLKQEREKWKGIFENYPSPRVSVIIGGSTKKEPFTSKMAQNLVQNIFQLNPGSVFITTSRRTPPNVIEILKKSFSRKTTYFYQYGDKKDNPYFGLLSWADQIVVTGDSISMCSECCASGVPVYIYAPEKMTAKKHQRFHRELYRLGYATALGSGQTAFGGRLNAAEDIAQKIKSLLEVKKS